MNFFDIGYVTAAVLIWLYIFLFASATLLVLFQIALTKVFSSWTDTDKTRTTPT